MSKILFISGAPHIHSSESVKKIMWGVVIALIPTLLVSVFFFGFAALSLVGVSVAACLFFEWAITKYLLKRPSTVGDGSAMITGLLLAFNLPPELPFWMVILGAFVAIGIAKMAFGGLGNNPFNPALVGRAFLLVSFPVEMTKWTAPKPLFGNFAVDATTGATPLSYIKEMLGNGMGMNEILANLHASDLFLGMSAGSLGEVSELAILIGGVYMLYKRIISWHVPVAFVGCAFVFTSILWMVDPTQFIPPTIHLVSGGMLLGAVFMATDMVTSPMTSAGKLIFGAFCGILTILIRDFGAYPEGVSFAILIMNAFVPLLNRLFPPKRFGY
ncbi:MAG: RnfABCDGE type electron transport complex subunit D [Bacteroidales bacterium]